MIGLCHVTQLCDHTYTVTDRTTLEGIMGWEGRMTDDDPVCPCMSAILIQPSRLRDYSSLPAPLPGALCFGSFMETRSLLTSFAMRSTCHLLLVSPIANLFHVSFFFLLSLFSNFLLGLFLSFSVSNDC